MRRLHSLHFLALFALLLLCWSIHFLYMDDDTYTGLLLAWYIAAALFLILKYHNGELAHESLY